jgi:Arc/MetJ-type ribon-helix-helix transcriptional regulator
MTKKKTSISLPPSLIERLEALRQKRAIGRCEPPSLADVVRDMLVLGLAYEGREQQAGEQR